MTQGGWKSLEEFTWGKHPCVKWDEEPGIKPNYQIDRQVVTHGEIYQSAYGPIPKGFHIHTSMKIKGNDLENLEALLS